MKTYLLVAIIGLIILQNTACIHYYYAPNSNNVPLFKEKGEARVQAQYTQLQLMHQIRILTV